MNHLKALVTGLVVLGSTSAALARPAAPAPSSWSAPTRGTVVVRDHRDARDHRAPAPLPATKPAPAPVIFPCGTPPFVPTWTNLGGMSQIFDGEMSFDVAPAARRFTTLKLQSTSGKTLVNRVEIEFANGRTQVVQLDKYLMASSPTITIDLAGEAGRAIRNVTVVGRNARQSTYSVLAS